MRRLLFTLAVLLAAVPAWAQQSNTSYADRFRFIPTGCTLRSGTGSPEGVVVGSVCDVYVRKDTSGLNPGLYTKQTGTLTNTGWVAVGGAAGAPTDATYITQTANGTLTNEQALGALATGILKNTTTTGVLSIATAGTDYFGPTADAVLNTGYDLKIAMATPTAPTITQDASGTLANGTYKLTLTAIDLGGGQTLYPASANCVVTTTSNDACVATWAAVPGAATYRIWISDADGATPNKFWVVGATVLTKTITSMAMSGVISATLPVASTACLTNFDGASNGWIGNAQTFFGPGSPSAPAISIGATANVGFYGGSSYIGAVVGGAGVAGFASGEFFFPSGTLFEWTSGSLSAGIDTRFGRESGAVMQFGADAASATDYLLKGADRITSDGVGSALILGGGRGRGNIGGVIKIQTAPAAAAGVAGTLADRVIVDTSGDVTVGSNIGTGAGKLYAGTYYAGTTSGVDCASASAVTTIKGIVTACSAPDPLLTPQALAAQIAELRQQVAELQTALGLVKAK